MSIIRRIFSLSTLLAVSTLALLLFSSAAAQLNTAKIEGTVRDQDTGAPLAGVQVTVEGTRLGNITNDDGYFFVLNVPAGRRNVVFTFTGYQKTTVTDVLMLAGQTMTVNANLSSTIVEIEGITVEGVSEVLLPRDQTVSKQRLTSEKLDETPTTKLEDLMILEAGVQTGGEGGRARGLRIRGGRLGEEAMVVDGVTVRNYTANPFREGVFWIHNQEQSARGEDASPLEFSTTSVEEVDILTGGFQAEYGQAQSGIVNIVTKEGGPKHRGNFRIISDELNPRTADYGYNQLQTNFGGPVPLIENLFYHVSGEIQGFDDRFPTHADEGFRGINQKFVDHLNHGVRNDPIFGQQQPAFTLDMLRVGRESFIQRMQTAYPNLKLDPAYDFNQGLFSPPHPARQPRNWQDRTTTTGKLTYSPFSGLKLLSTSQFSRSQNTWPNITSEAGADIWFKNGFVTSEMLPLRRWDTARGDHQMEDGTWWAIIPPNTGRRTRTSNFLAGANWDFYKTPTRNAALQFRYTNFRVQDINNSNLKDNYERKTIFAWTPHDIPFQVETYPNREAARSLEDAQYYYPDGASDWAREGQYATPFGYEQNVQLYYMEYRYTREQQHNFKTDVDFQLNRYNRMKFGAQLGVFDNQQFSSGRTIRIMDNEFNYRPRLYGFYAQNRTDLGDFVFDYGLRYDSFQPRDNWGFRHGDYWGERYYPENFHEFSPRFDVGFPVTDRAQLRFSYGVFTQVPSFSNIFSSGNPGGLGFSRTDAFETGMSYMLSSDVLVDFVGFYRDADGNLAQGSFFRDYTEWRTGRHVRGMASGYVNHDKGNIKGMDITLRKRFSDNYSMNVIYTLQFARSTGSSYLATTSDELRPNDGDRAHKFSTYLNYIVPRNVTGNELFNRVINDLNAYAIGTFQSGSPTGELSRRRGRWDYNVNLRLSKPIFLGDSRRLSLMADITNLTNRKLPRSYPSGYSYQGYRYVTGGRDLKWEDASFIDKWRFQADFDGDGILTVEEAAKGSIAASLLSNLSNLQGWGIARQVRLGLDFSF